MHVPGATLSNVRYSHWIGTKAIVCGRQCCLSLAPCHDECQKEGGVGTREWLAYLSSALAIASKLTKVHAPVGTKYSSQCCPKHVRTCITSRSPTRRAAYLVDNRRTHQPPVPRQSPPRSGRPKKKSLLRPQPGMPARTRSLRSSLQPPCSPPSPDPARRPSVPLRAEGEGARRLTETVRRRRLSRPPNGPWLMVQWSARVANLRTDEPSHESRPQSPGQGVLDLRRQRQESFTATDTVATRMEAGFLV